MSVRTTNVSVFSLDSDVWAATCGDVKKVAVLAVDGDNIQVDLDNSDSTILFVRGANAIESHRQSPWKVRSSLDLHCFERHGSLNRSSHVLTHQRRRHTACALRPGASNPSSLHTLHSHYLSHPSRPPQSSPQPSASHTRSCSFTRSTPRSSASPRSRSRTRQSMSEKVTWS